MYNLIHYITLYLWIILLIYQLFTKCNQCSFSVHLNNNNIHTINIYLFISFSIPITPLARLPRTAASSISTTYYSIWCCNDNGTAVWIWVNGISTGCLWIRNVVIGLICVLDANPVGSSLSTTRYSNVSIVVPSPYWNGVYMHPTWSVRTLNSSMVCTCWNLGELWWSSIS